MQAHTPHTQIHTQTHTHTHKQTNTHTQSCISPNAGNEQLFNSLVGVDLLGDTFLDFFLTKVVGFFIIKSKENFLFQLKDNYYIKVVKIVLWMFP